MRRSFTVRALGGLTVFAVVFVAAAQAGPDGTTGALPPELELVQQEEPIEAAEELTGDVEFSVPGGTFQNQVSVALSTRIAGAQIRYTTDGELPTASSPLYSGMPLTFTTTTRLRARPFVGGAAEGDPGTAIYVAETVTTSHDIPVLVIDAYGQPPPDREYIDGAFTLFDPAGGTTALDGTPAFTTRAGFRLRGQSSATFPKTPYRIELWDNDDDDADYPVLGMPADSDWVLRGPFPDKALIREALVLDLGREMGIFAPRYEFIEFYLNAEPGPVDNDDYMGVYMLMENIKNNSVRLDLKQLEEEDVTLPDITGGYIWKFDWLAAEEPIVECPGAGPTCWNFLEITDPEPLNAEQEAWLAGHLSEFNDMLQTPQFTDPQTGYRAYIDTASFVDLLILNELSRELDSYVRSTYFYKDRGGKIFAGPLWDYDLSFGVGGFFQNDQIAGWQYEQTRQPMVNNWYQRLLTDPAFVDQVRTRWRQLRSGVLSDAQLTARISDLTAPLVNAAQRNFQRWPNLTSPMVSFFFTPTAPTWQGQVQVMEDWLLQRADWLDSPDGWDIDTATPPSSPSPSPSSSPTSSPTPSPTASPTVSPTSSPTNPGGGCTATYTVVNQWPGGFQGGVEVTAGSSSISGWSVSWTFTDGQSINQAWSATVTGGPTVTATNMTWNGSLAAGASTSFGFIGTWNGANSAPTVTCTAS